MATPSRARRPAAASGRRPAATAASPRSSLAGSRSPVPEEVAGVLGSPGNPLATATRSFFEPRFGHDFGRVRVHADARAADAARAVGALAYTVGRDVVFGRGRYAPGSAEGDRLIAHELAHVAQQRADASGAVSTVSPPGEAPEREAASLTEAVTRGTGTHRPAARAASGTVYRAEGEAATTTAPATAPATATEAAPATTAPPSPANRPARPSTPAAQMSALLAAATNTNRMTGKCYHFVKGYIKAAGGYGDILDIQADERFKDYLRSAVQFAAAVEANGAANLGLEVVTGSPPDAEPGTLLVLKGNGKVSLSEVYGDISVVGGVEDSERVSAKGNPYTVKLLVCYNDGRMTLPADAASWAAGGRYDGTLVGMYKPIARP